MPFPENIGERQLRAWALGLVLTGALALLGARLFYLQVVQGESYAQKAQENMVRPERIAAHRGRIFDREGRLLAGNRVGFNLNLDTGHPIYADLDRLDLTVAEVASILGRAPQDLQSRARRYRRMYEPLLLGRDLEPATLAPFVERLNPIPGLTIDQVPIRWYPSGSLAAHALGYVGVITEEELAQGGAVRHQRGVFLGRSGIEYRYESELRGRDGRTYVEVDAAGRKTDLFANLPPVPPIPGADIHLTLDARLQRVAEEALRLSRGNHPDSIASVRGAVVALDPWSGEVWVCASAPGFDPNDFAHGLTAAQWARLNDERHPLLSRVIQAAYPPGSIFKTATSLAAVETGVVDGESSFEPCRGLYRFGNRPFRCWREEGHGRLDMLHAFERSCDIYFYQVGRRIGLNALLDYLQTLHLDAPTGIDLPEERAGLIPTLEWYRRRLGTEPPEGNVLNLAIGQGEIILTPIELTCFVGALVTDGVVRRPFLARRAERPDGEVLWARERSEPLHDLDLPAAQLDLMRTLLEQVVAGDRGTGRSARVSGYRVGGKTGTAQNPHGEDHALFVGVAPMENPSLVVLAVVELAGHGGSVAAPVVQAVLEAYLKGGPTTVSERVAPHEEPEGAATKEGAGT